MTVAYRHASLGHGGGDTLEKQNLAMMHRVVDEIWNRGELEAADVMFTSDYINHGGLIVDLVRGPEAIKISVVLYRLAFPDLKITIKNLIAEASTVSLHWTARRSPHESPGAFTGMLVCRFIGGAIGESWMQWDQKNVLEHLGVVNSAAPAEG